MRVLPAAAAAAAASSLLLALLPSPVHSSGLVDNPIVSDAIQYLDGEGWSATNGAGITVGARVPGDLLTDLQMAGVIGDPLYEMNWIPRDVSNSSPVWDATKTNWTYTTSFDLTPPLAAASTVWLVLDGVKMVADVWLNGAYLGYTADQFVRYVWPATALRPTGNTLTVTFTTSADTRNNEGRFMACTGGWDWAAYSNTQTAAGTRTFSKGIWKSVSLVAVSSTALTHVVPHVFYNGSYPTAPLTDATAGPWTVNVRVHFQSPAGATGTLAVTSDFGGSASQPVTLPAGNSSVTVPVAVPAGSVKLWWPNGMGAQALYNVGVTFTPSSGAALSASRRIGFRVFVLVTGNDTDPTTLAGKDGSGGFTMRFKVNGADIYARGGNMIPIDELEGRRAAETYVSLVRSAAAGGMNVFRIWGGGVYYDDAFYDTADELGMLMYHDLMESGDGHVNPVADPTQDAELRHQVRRLSHHPSIALWDSCNECGGGGIFDSFVITTVAEEDTSRPVWPSCPSYGWTSGVDTLWGLPNGNPLVTNLGGAASGREAAASLVARDRFADDVVFEEPRVWTAPCGSAAGNCTFVANYDYDQGFIGKTPAAADANACCALCQADPADCYAASFYEGTCYFKPSGKKFSTGSNVVSVFPPGSTPPALPPRTVETHGYYQHGGSTPAVNGDETVATFPIYIPTVLTGTGPRGPELPGIFASEFGASVYSSFESMAPTLAPEHWSISGGAPPDSCSNSGWPSTCTGGNVMAQRNYPCHNFLLSYYGRTQFDNANATGDIAFKKQLYLCTLSQALFIRSDVEGRRSDNHFGTITWQLNEIWPTGGWGSLEYGTTGFTAGQVVGGRWKPLHHMMSTHLYIDQIAVCGNDGRCYVRNDDALNAFTGSVAASFVHLATGAVSPVQTVPVSLPRGAAALEWFCLGAGSNITAGCTPLANVLTAAGCSPSGSDCFLVLNATEAATGAVADENWQVLIAPGNLTLPTAHVSFTVSQPNPDGSVPVTVSADATALYIYLSTAAAGRFSDNSFHLAAGTGASKTVTFLPFGELDYGALASTLRVEHLQSALSF